VIILLDSQDLIISDKSVLQALSSNEDDEFESGQLIIEFLAWRRNNKKILTSPRIYNELFEKIKLHPELKAYFENFFESGSFIGMSETNPDTQEFSSLLYNLYVRGKDLLMFVSNDETLRTVVKENKPPKTVFRTVQGLGSWLRSNQEFSDFIFD